jgi:PTS system N-acetylglucosamine-specific IIC component
MNAFSYLQRLGKALMLPIATLPVAAILLRLGQPDVFNIPFIASAGGGIFDSLPLLFALGLPSVWQKTTRVRRHWRGPWVSWF